MLIIEDGTGKVDSQSYVSADELRAYAAARGLSVPSSDVQLEAALISAVDYLEIQACYTGKKSSSLQALEWPRSGVVFKGEDFPNNAIPKNLKVAQIRLAINVLNGVVLMPTISGSAEDYVVKEKVGPIETEYADPTKFTGVATFTDVDALLQTLRGDECASGMFFKVYRA